MTPLPGCVLSVPCLYSVPGVELGLWAWRLAPLPTEPSHPSGPRTMCVHHKMRRCSGVAIMSQILVPGVEEVTSCYQKPLCTLVTAASFPPPTPPPKKISLVLEITFKATKYRNGPVKPAAHISTTTMQERASPAPASPLQLFYIF